MPTPSQITRIAEGYYSQHLPYHNFDHARAALKAARTLCRLCQKHDVSVNQTVVELAVLFHDAGYAEDHRALGYDTKEAYAAAIARRELSKLGYGTDVIEPVVHAILCTKIDDEALCRSNEDYIVRLADVFNVTQSYATFLENNRRVKAEVEQLSGKAISQADWQQSTAEILGHYVDEQQGLTEEAKAAIRRARANIERYTSQD